MCIRWAIPLPIYFDFIPTGVGSRLFYLSSDGRESSGDSPACASFVWTGKAPHCNFGATEDAGYGAQSPELGSPALLSPAPPVISGKGLPLSILSALWAPRQF